MEVFLKAPSNHLDSTYGTNSSTGLFNSKFFLVSFEALSMARTMDA